MIYDRIKLINDRLKRGKIGITIELRGDRLSLRGTFPPKPGKPGVAHQQRIALGVRLNAEGFRTAENEARLIGALLARGEFNWNRYQFNENSEDKNDKISDWIEKLKLDYFSEKSENATTRQTWQIDYLQALQKLPSDCPLTEETLRKTLFEFTKPETRTRRRYALAYAKLADLAGINHGIRELVGSYSSKAVSPRDLPDDEEIVKTRESIKSDAWRWAFGMQSVYGLRNHEIFFTDLLDFPIAYINRGKTNERYTWPLYPEWAIDWHLDKNLIPQVSGEKNSDYGHRVTVAYRREGVRFSPYNLRHCWAVRSINFGLDVSLAAAQLGHSVRVHTEIYRLWITRKTHERAMTLLLNRADRPLPP
jgi:integrase